MASYGCHGWSLVKQCYWSPFVTIWRRRTMLGSQTVYHYSECRNLSTSFISKCFCLQPQTLYWSYCTVYKMGKRPSRKLYTRKSRLCFYERSLPRIMREMWRKGKHCGKNIGDLQIICNTLHRFSILCYFYFRVAWMNMKNVQNGQELDIVPNILPLCFSTVESLVGPVDSNHVSHSDCLFFRPTTLAILARPTRNIRSVRLARVAKPKWSARPTSSWPARYARPSRPYKLKKTNQQKGRNDKQTDF